MTIDGYTIESNGDVPAGLAYIERNWNTEEVKEIFRNSRNPENESRGEFFQITVDGYAKHYILKHTGDYTYFLKANY